MAARNTSAVPIYGVAAAADAKMGQNTGMADGFPTVCSRRAIAGDEKLTGGVEDDFNEAAEKNPAVLASGRHSDETEVEAQPQKKLPYPKAVFFILGNEFCERFCFYGMKAVLALYLTRELKYSESAATFIFHLFLLSAYFTALLGAYIADSYWGKFKTILYLSILYAMGNVTLSVSAMPFSEGSLQFVLTFLGLAIIALGTGGIKPCVSSFGGDQFVLPEQELHLQRFFAIFYLSINAGSLISSFLTPILRKDVRCFNKTTCYSLAFGIPAVFMAIALLLFIFGKPFYTILKPKGNVVAQVFSCIGHAISNKRKGKDPFKTHWLDYADDRYSQEFIEDVKGVLRVLLLYWPLPIFWALFDQQGSRWTLQATRMDGYITSGFSLKPDQVHLLNPLLILTLIPLFQSVIYPLCYKVGILRRPLQKMVLGMVLAGAAFAVSGIIELKLKGLARSSEGNTRLTLMNTLECPVTLRAPALGTDPITVPAAGVKHLQDVPAKTDVKFHFAHANCVDSKWDPTVVYTGQPGNAYSIVIFRDGLRKTDAPNYALSKNSGVVIVRVTHGTVTPGTQVTFKSPGKNFSFHLGNAGSTGYEAAEPGQHTVLVNDAIASSQPLEFEVGGVYEVALSQLSDNTFRVSNYVDTQPSSTLHMLWQTPQYVLITIGEIMFSPTGLEFSFTQSPVTMKAVIQAAWLLSVSAGNLIVMIIAGFKIFHDQWAEFFFFALLIWVFACFFSIMAWRYKYKEYEPDGDNKKRQSMASVLGQEGATSTIGSKRSTIRRSKETLP